MATKTFGGTGTSTTGFTDNWVRTTGNTAPSGRAALDGSEPVRTSRVKAYASGRGASRSCQLKVDGQATSSFTISSAGSANDTGWRTLVRLLEGGESLTLQIDCDGSFYFARGGSGSSEDSYGYVWSDGRIYFAIEYAIAPTAAQSVAVTPGVGEADVTWAAPSDDGGSSITGYRVQASLSPSFTSPINEDVGAVTSATVTGLTPGQTYYFRVLAQNAVTDLAGTYAVASSTASALIGDVPDAPGTPTLTALDGAVRAVWTAPGDDGGVAIIDYEAQIDSDSGFSAPTAYTGLTSLDKTLGVDVLAPDTTYYVRVRARNAVGNGAWSTSASTTTLDRTFLDSVEVAAIQLAGGVHVSLRTDGADTPTITLGYSALTDGTTWNTIATVPTGLGAGQFAVPGGSSNLALVADASGNLYVIGREGSGRNKVLIKRYARSGTSNAWPTSGASSQALTDTGDALRQFAACYVPGSGGSPVATILVLARRAGSVAAGGLSYATVSTSAVEASSATPFVASGSDPSWLSTPPSSATPNGSALDLARMTSAGTRVAIAANGYAVVDVTNGSVATVAKASSGSSLPGAKVRVVPVSASVFALLRLSSGSLVVEFRSSAGALLGSATIAAADSQGGAFASQWDAVYNRVTGVVSVFYVADDDGRKVERVDVSTSTYAASAAVVVTSALGSASSVNGRLRAPRGHVDERRILIAAANLLSGTQSLASLSTTSGNVAPSAPTLSPRSDFDATFAATFAWVFGDNNPDDAQTSYQLQIDRVSDSVNVYDSGKVASATASMALTAATLTNGIDYRWRVRTYDALDQAGAWSDYGTFSASALGTLTITDPASDNPAGVDTASYEFAWSYSQADGYTQTQRRVKVVRTSDESTVSDTTMQASTAMTYLVTGLESDVEYRVEVTLVNSNGQTTGTATRLITPSYGVPMTPTIVLSVGVNYVRVTIANPEPEGDRPEVTRNRVQRRPTGSGDDWTEVGEVAPSDPSSVYDDRTVKSGQAYDYRVIGDTE